MDNIDSTIKIIKKICNDIDSVKVTVFDVVTKEMGGIHETPHKKELGTFSISKKDSDKFCSFLQEPKHYSDSRAILSHHNVIFQFYQKDLIVLKVVYSTYTGNMFVCTKTFLDNANTCEFSDCLYENISLEYEEKMKRILKTYNVIDLIDESLWRNYYLEE